MDRSPKMSSFQRNDLIIKESLLDTRFYIKGCRVDGKLGAPAFPVKKIKIAMPDTELYQQALTGWVNRY